MKKFAINFFYVALVFAMTGLLSSCHDDNKEVIDDENNDPEYEILEPPTEDLMEVTSIINLYVPSTDGLSDVAQALIRRCPFGEDYSACAILLTSKFIDAADDATLTIIKDFYNDGGMIIMDRPTPRNFKKLEAGMELDEIADPMEEHDDHEAYGIYAFNKHFDIYKLNDVFDEDGTEYKTCSLDEQVDENGESTPVEEYGEGVSEGREEQPLTPYLAGLIADPLAHWMTENNIPDEWRESRKKQIIANSRANIDDILHAQSITDTWTNGVSVGFKDECSGQIWEKLKDRHTVFTTTTRIYVAYSYHDDMDYYLFDQVVWANNSHKWLGSWSSGSYDYQGLYLYGIDIKNNIIQGSGWSNYVKRSDGLILEDFSPETTVGSKSYSSSTGFNIGGNVGAAKTGPTLNITGGISVSVSESYSIPDLSITCMCGDDPELGNNCKWEYRTRRNNIGKKWTGKPYFYSPTELSINTIKVGQSWVWKLQNPKRYDNTTLYLRYSIGAWDYSDKKQWKFFYSKTGCHGEWSGLIFKHKIIMPNRDPEL